MKSAVFNVNIERAFSDKSHGSTHTKLVILNTDDVSLKSFIKNNQFHFDKFDKACRFAPHHHTFHNFLLRLCNQSDTNKDLKMLAHRKVDELSEDLDLITEYTFELTSHKLLDIIILFSLNILAENLSL